MQTQDMEIKTLTQKKLFMITIHGTEFLRSTFVLDYEVGETCLLVQPKLNVSRQQLAENRIQQGVVYVPSQMRRLEGLSFRSRPQDPTKA